MKTDYAYCNNHQCQHKKECRRWIGNYSDEELGKWVKSGRNEYLDDYSCESTDYSLKDKK